jgi:hypothetical protein
VTSTIDDTSFHAVRRRLADALADVQPIGTPRSLETSERGAREAPAIREATVIEGDRMVARVVSGPHEPRFDAFLDGSQLTLVARWHEAIPIVHGTVSAAVRQRRERRLTTWGSPIVRRALYAPLPLLPKTVLRALDATGVDVVDTLARKDPPSTHPFALQDVAYQRVLSDRERVEQELAAQWCDAERGLLFVDGGIAGNADVAVATNVVGVVKSHQTLYAAGNDLSVITALETGARSSVMRVDGKSRSAIASWYLRTTDATGRDPFWGLVRVEVALDPDATRSALTRRADEVSRWILAERLPLSVPDPRWDRMAYGIRDAEEYLRAVQ